jgi:hypothetical protein
MKLLINPLKLSDEELDNVQNLAAANYAPEKIALYLDVDRKQFLDAWNDPDGEIRIFYNRGQLLSEFKVNDKQRELAESGNITAAQIFLKEREKINVDNLRNKFFFDA